MTAYTKPPIETLSPDLRYQLWQRDRKGKRVSWGLTLLLAAPAVAFIAIKPVNDSVTFIDHVLSFFNLSPLSFESSEQQKTRAMLDTIAFAEGTGDDYAMQFTGTGFGSYAEHPQEIKCSGELCSDASGRYQFMSPTWARLKAKLGLTDFSPANQDKAAVELLRESGAYAKLQAGDVDGAMCAAGGTWASLPCNDYGQPQKSREQLKDVFESNLSKRITSKPSSGVFPLAGLTPATAPITSPWGLRWGGEMHSGVDYGVATGTPVVAPEAGTILLINDDRCGVGVQLGMSGNRTAISCHLSRVNVADGSRVNAGDAIGETGNTGRSTAPHYHFGLKVKGEYVDPQNYLNSLK